MKRQINRIINKNFCMSRIDTSNNDKRTAGVFHIYQPFLTGFRATLGVGLGILCCLLILRMGVLFAYIGLALFITLAIEPLISALVKLGISRGVSVVLLLLFFSAFLGVALWLIIPILTSETALLWKTVSSFMTEGNYRQFISLLRKAIPDFDFNELLQQGWLWIQNNVTTITGSVVNIGIGIVNTVTGIVIVLILTIYFSATLPTIKATGYKLVPASRREFVKDTLEDVLSSVGRYTAGQFLLASINGTLTLLIFSILQFKYPILMAFIAFIGSMIPLVGTISSSALISGITLFSAQGWTVWAVVIYYLVYMNVEAYVISPKIMKKAVSVPGSLVVISALAGGMLAGVPGAVVAVPAAASIVVLIKRVLIDAK
ncbi:AI-2E family transporter [Tropheryma whipplei]|nr:AI-2E family transporter [Tropheryma whipplei]MCO8182319.1 AI-2E family transporter [Tropheryma whipplei]MCO8190088.1 AI-2E family transporter [Tropheryma whipplei]